MVISTVENATSVGKVPTTEETTQIPSVSPSSETPSEPQKPAEPEKPSQKNLQLDLAFCCDCTGSMSSYIAQAQENIRKIATEVSISTDAQIQFALVTYRDHPPQDSTYVTQTYPFTNSLSEMQTYVNTMSAQGGGDGPEAVADGLYEVWKLKWRPNSTKVCVLISDAPPHGLGESDDGFPNGCPDGHDPLKICRELGAMGVVVYAVGVEPVLSRSYKFARDFMMSVAKITNGKYLPLGKAELLAKAIVGGCMEGLVMDSIWDEVEKEIQQVQSETGGVLSETDVAAKVEGRLKGKVGGWAIETDRAKAYGDDYDDFNCDLFAGATSLRDAKPMLDSARNAAACSKVSNFSWAEQKCHSEAAPISKEQISRCGKKKGFWGK